MVDFTKALRTVCREKAIIPNNKQMMSENVCTTYILSGGGINTFFETVVESPHIYDDVRHLVLVRNTPLAFIT